MRRKLIRNKRIVPWQTTQKFNYMQMKYTAMRTCFIYWLRTSFFLRPLSLFLSVLLALGFISNVGAAENPDRQDQGNSLMNTALPPPGSPQVMWQRILMMLNKDLGFVTKKQVEDLIGVPFSETEKDGEKRSLGAAFLHSHRGEIPILGKLEMELFEDPKKSILTIIWGDPLEETPGCLSYKKVSSDLRTLGFWENDGVYSGARPSNVKFLLWKDIEEFKRLVVNAIDKNEKNKLVWEFEMVRNNIYVVIPRDKSQCVTGISINSLYPK